MRRVSRDGRLPVFCGGGRMIPPISLRPASPSDESFLLELFKSVRASEFAPAALPAPQLDLLLTMQFKAQRGAYETTYPGAQHAIVLPARLRSATSGWTGTRRGIAWSISPCSLIIAAEASAACCSSNSSPMPGQRELPCGARWRSAIPGLCVFIRGSASPSPARTRSTMSWNIPLPRLAPENSRWY